MNDKVKVSHKFPPGMSRRITEMWIPALGDGEHGSAWLPAYGYRRQEPLHCFCRRCQQSSLVPHVTENECNS